MSEVVLSSLPGARPSVTRWRIPDLIASPRMEVYRRLALAVASVAIAYHYSLGTLVRSLKVETPLAYLGLVPFIAVVLAAACVRPGPNEPAIHDRQLDYLVGVPLIAAAVVFDILMPVRMSTLFWLYRMDLVGLPLFAAGVVALLFGVRTLWRIRIPILFLILAWPLPYTTLLVNWLTAFTSSTLHGLNFLLRFVHVATPASGFDAGTYNVVHAKNVFQVSVASACSGVNGAVGYAMIAVAFLTVITGGWVRKALWLGLGLLGVWASNVVRIFLIVAVGHLYGESMAINVLHPVMGLVTFNIIVVAMVVLMGPFGLRLRQLDKDRTSPLATHLRTAVPKLRVAAVVVIVFTVISAISNQSLRTYDLVLSSLGSPRLVSFSDSPAHPAGFSVVRTNVYTTGKPFFGSDSTWYRYSFIWDSNQADAFRSNSPVISDVINTSDVSSFSAYGIEACYRFHGFKLYSIRTVDLGHGVTGNALAYYNTQTHSDWTLVYWHWPVRTSKGKTRFERVTLMLVGAADAQLAAPAPRPTLLGQLGLSVQNTFSGKSATLGTTLNRDIAFLIAFAGNVIQLQGTMSATTSSAVA